MRIFVDVVYLIDVILNFFTGCAIVLCVYAFVWIVPYLFALVQKLGLCVVMHSRTTGYLSFHPMAQCVVHALKGLACRASLSRTR